MLFLVTTLLVSCKVKVKQDTEEMMLPVKRDFAEIRQSGVLKVVIDYNSTNYFVYRGKPMGFQYELLNKLAKDLDLELQLIVSNNLKETFDGLLSGKYDLVAKNLTVTKKRNEIVNFTQPLTLTRQVLVQRKPEGYEKMSAEELNKKLIRNQLELANKPVVVQKNTAYYTRLLHLSDEIGEPIDIKEDTIYGVERLMALVASGEIDYTVGDEHVAQVNQSYFPNLDVNTPVSFEQKLSWAVRKNSPDWENVLNKWIDENHNTTWFAVVYNKYFKAQRAQPRMDSDYHSFNGGKLSAYDLLVKKMSHKYSWDWRLIAALIFQESRFKPDAESWAGAYGLMQVMPETADRFDIADFQTPKANLLVGLKMLNWLDEQFTNEITDREVRLKFVLAAYNVGLGHVKDAQRLARKYGKNPKLWDGNVDEFLLNKSSSKYYKDPVVKWGYCRGEEPYNYVIEILNRYQHYQNLIN
ncbi:transporter substrate-binding domain-containing protein [Prolixibacteraceae bacterium JC049]|nr:transporter substrate-binding domain-containing protein [Prolixibacteraceae bacterium JC049]